jgi:AcrR family transcriptional regulator
MAKSKAKKLNFWQTKHREREIAILASAKKLILKKGIAKASMDVIAKESGLSRQRLYKYFPNLESVVYSIEIDDMTRFLYYLDGTLAYKATSSKDFLEKIITGAFEYAKKNVPDFLFTMAFDSYYGVIKVPPELGKTYEEVVGGGKISTPLFQILTEGIKNKEFRGDLDFKETAIYWINNLQATLVRYAFFLHKGDEWSLQEADIIEKGFLDSFFRYLK